jgi:hypothetical protein
MQEYLESATGQPNEITVLTSPTAETLWLEQDDDMIEIDDQQASNLIRVLTKFLNRV